MEKKFIPKHLIITIIVGLVMFLNGRLQKEVDFAHHAKIQIIDNKNAYILLHNKSYKCEIIK